LRRARRLASIAGAARRAPAWHHGCAFS
jgi:hypothetical protein